MGASLLALAKSIYYVDLGISVGVHHIEHSWNPLGDLSIPRGFRRTRHNRQKKVIVAFVSFNQVRPANCSLVLPYGSLIDYFFLTTCGILGFFPYRSCSFAVCNSAHRVILAPFWGIILSFHAFIFYVFHFPRFPFVWWPRLSQMYLSRFILLLRGFTLICNANLITVPS